MSILTKEVIQKILNDDWLLMDDCEGLENCTVIKELARMALAAMDSEPDCKERKLFCSTDTTRMRKTISVSAGTEDAPLYRHAQQSVVERKPIAWINDAYLARGVVDGEDGSEDAGPGYIPVYRHAQPAPIVPEEWTISDAVKFCKETGRQDAGAAMDAWNACRAAMLNGGKP